MHEISQCTVGQEIPFKVDEEKMRSVEIEIMLHINNRIFQQGLIPEEIYRLAKEMFLRT